MLVGSVPRIKGMPMALESPGGLALICQNPLLISRLWRATALAWMANPRREMDVTVEKCMVGVLECLGMIFECLGIIFESGVQVEKPGQQSI